MKKSELRQLIKEEIQSILKEVNGEPFDYEWGKGVSIGGTKPSTLTIYYDKRSNNMSYSYDNTRGTMSDVDLKNLYEFLGEYIKN